MTSEQFDAVIVGAGFGGIGAAIQLKRLGYRELRHPRPRGRPRRNLARQPLPRPGRRRPHHHLLLLLRAEPELVAAVLHRRGDQAVRRRRRRQVRRAPPHAVQHHRRGRPLGRGRQDCGASRWPTATTLTARVPDHRDRIPVAAAACPTSRASTGFARQGHPHHRLGRRLRPRRVSGSPSSAPAPPRCSSSPSSPRRPPTSPSISAPRSGWCPRSTSGSPSAPSGSSPEYR